MTVKRLGRVAEDLPLYTWNGGWRYSTTDGTVIDVRDFFALGSRYGARPVHSDHSLSTPYIKFMNKQRTFALKCRKKETVKPAWLRKC